MIREAVLQYGTIVAIGVLVGSAAIMESFMPAVLAAGAAMLILSLYRPTLPITLAFLGILLDARGMTSVRVLGVPLTLSKMAVLFAIGSHFTNSMVRRVPPIVWAPVTPGVVGIVLTMILSLVTAVDPSWGYTDTIGVIMLAVMTHLIYQAVKEEDLPWMIRLMSAFTVLILAWTLFTQRKEGFFVTLDHAWQQRTSGAYNDPNAWSTALLVICPMLIAGLSVDRHPLATPLLIGVASTFPLCILQSMSRAGLLSFVIIAPGLIFILRRRKMLLLFAGLSLLLLLPMIINLEAALLRYRTLLDPTLEADLGHGSLRERRALLEAGLQIFWEHPYLGVGTGLFRVHASYVSAGEVWKIAHNSYVNVAAEQGVPGLISHAYLGFLLYKTAWHGAMRSQSELTRSVGQGFLLSLIAFSAMALTLNLATFAAAWFMLSLGLVVARLGGSETVPDRMERLRAAAVQPRAETAPA
ncbi:MAG TPA: O-antigen ligase family protein [Myxococcota bacterium]|nr:O-antigen ligase family protein [Myxococcota bacterium]